MATGAPILANSIMSLDCVLLDLKEVGTHTIFFGTVVGTRLTHVRADGARRSSSITTGISPRV